MKKRRTMFAAAAIAITATVALASVPAKAQYQEQSFCDSIANCYSLDCMFMKWIMNC